MEHDEMIETQNQKRILNLSSATCTVICTMIGAGIFMTTGLYASELDSGIGIIVVWGISGLLAICGSLCAIELASIWPEAGGIYIFIRNIFGRPFGFLAGFSMAFFAVTGSIAFVAGSFGAHMEELLPLVPGQIYASLAVLFITTIQLVGVREGNAINVFGALFKISLLLIFIIFGFSVESTAGKEILHDEEINPLTIYDRIAMYGAAIAATSFAYQGNMATSYIAGEIVNPEKNLSRSMLLGVMVVTILYMMINVVYLLGARPYEMVDNQGNGIQTIGFFVAERLFGKSIGFTANLLIISILFLTIGPALMIGSRVLYSMARRGELPKKISRLNKGGSPPYALIIMSTLSLMLIWATGLRELLESVGTVVIINSGIAALGVIFLRVRKPDLRRPIKLPFFPLPPVIFLCLTLWITWGVFSTNITSVILISLIIITGLAIWFCYSNKHSKVIKNS